MSKQGNTLPLSHPTSCFTTQTNRTDDRSKAREASYSAVQPAYLNSVAPRVLASPLLFLRACLGCRCSPSGPPSGPYELLRWQHGRRHALHHLPVIWSRPAPSQAASQAEPLRLLCGDGPTFYPVLSCSQYSAPLDSGYIIASPPLVPSTLGQGRIFGSV